MVPLYFPVVVNLETTLFYLNEQFSGLALSFEPVLEEILRETFNRKPGTYGLSGRGPLGALRVQLPEFEPAHYTEADLDRVLHYAKGYLMEEMTAITLGGVTQATPYRYIGGDTVLLYLPLPENCVDATLRQSAVPREAISYLD